MRTLHNKIMVCKTLIYFYLQYYFIRYICVSIHFFLNVCYTLAFLHVDSKVEIQLEQRAAIFILISWVIISGTSLPVSKQFCAIVYHKRAIINRSNSDRPLNFHWKNNFLCVFTSQSQGKNDSFSLLTADNDGALTVYKNTRALGAF